MMHLCLLFVSFRLFLSPVSLSHTHTRTHLIGHCNCNVVRSASATTLNIKKSYTILLCPAMRSIQLAYLDEYKPARARAAQPEYKIKSSIRSFVTFRFVQQSYASHQQPYTFCTHLWFYYYYYWQWMRTRTRAPLFLKNVFGMKINRARALKSLNCANCKRLNRQQPDNHNNQTHTLTKQGAHTRNKSSKQKVQNEWDVFTS